MVERCKNILRTISVLVLRVVVWIWLGRRRIQFTADQAGQQAFNLGFEPLLGILTRCLLFLLFSP
jgi:hypothetical protein